jgi:MtN3 and saliva related transmembrane protein
MEAPQERHVGLTTILGFIAATLTTLSFVPQALTVLRSKDVSGVSVAMYTLFSAGVALWLVYGVLVWSGPIIVANAITLALCLLILRTVRKRRREAAIAAEADSR